jgi:hypothetical protein
MVGQIFRIWFVYGDVTAGGGVVGGGGKVEVGWSGRGYGIKSLKVNKGDQLSYPPPTFNFYTSTLGMFKYPIFLHKINFASYIRRKRQRQREKRYEKILVSRQSLDPVLEFYNNLWGLGTE